MRNKPLTELEKKHIINLYDEGNSYKQITKITNFASSTLAKVLKGKRGKSEANKLSAKYRIISDEGRLKLSENGKRSCQRSGKFWTKPEVDFKKILNEIGIGVKFPDYIKEIKSISDDENPKVFYQYPIQRYVLDFVDIENKVAININGDYWHANPELYKNNLGKLQIINVRQDKNKRAYLEKHGWKVLDIWESEIHWNKALVIEKLRASGITVTRQVYTLESGVRSSPCPPSSNDWSETIKKLWFSHSYRKPKTERKQGKVEKARIICKYCKKEFLTRINVRKPHKYCSVLCSQKHSRKVNRPSKETLENEIQILPMVQIGRKYGVSDNSVRKWLKYYDIQISKSGRCMK